MARFQNWILLLPIRRFSQWACSRNRPEDRAWVDHKQPWWGRSSKPFLFHMSSRFRLEENTWFEGQIFFRTGNACEEKDVLELEYTVHFSNGKSIKSYSFSRRKMWSGNCSLHLSCLSIYVCLWPLLKTYDYAWLHNFEIWKLFSKALMTCLFLYLRNQV